jgi:hypothetical protein
MMTAMSAQDTKMQDTKKDMKDSEVKAVKANSLDGKAFKITLMSRNTEDVKMRESSDNNRSMPKSSTDRTQVQGGVNTNDVNTTPAPSSGTISGNATQGGAVAPVQNGSTTTAPESQTAVKDAAASPDKSMETPTAVPSDNTSTANAPVTQGSTGTTKTTDGDFVSNKKMILRFENGMIHSSSLATKGAENCPYHVTSNEATITSFTSNCTSSVTKVKGVWSGIVDGNSIRGNFTWTTDDGRNIYYTFTGSTATPKEVSAEQELGLK